MNSPTLIGTATHPTTAPPAVHLLDVRKTHPDGDGVTEALRGVTLALRRGSFTAVMGPSGSGKTTLLTVAAGLDTATSGRVVIGGRDLTGLGADDLTRFRREHVGFVFQAYNLVDHLSVRENVELPVRLAGDRPDPAWRDHLLDVVGLHGLEDRRPNELSGGQGQRVAIARALFTRPDIVFADEPTGALDSTTAADVLTLLRDTARELGQTVVVVTHDARVAAVADRVLFLADGRLVDELDDPTTDRIAARLPARAVSGMFGIALQGARSQKVPLAGTAVVVALAAALLSLTGVVFQTGAADPERGGLLVTLVSSFSGTALLTVVFAVVATVSLGLRQRRREFALLRAVGATRAQVRRLVGLETSLLTLVAAPLGAAGGLLLTPLLTPLLSGSGVVSTDVRWNLTPWPVAAATALLLPVTLLAARFAVRETLRVAPTAAVRESTVEPRTVGRARLVTAAVLAGLAVPVAATPLAVSGTQGAAVAAVSAFLLVGAAALAGPWWTERALRRTAHLPEGMTATPVRIALANSRGFSRRLAAVAVPLAVALALGVVQTGVGRAVDTAAHDQLATGLRADLVVTTPAGVAPDRIADLENTPGVRVAQPVANATLAVRTDAEAPGFLGWEYIGVGTVSPTGPLADPDVTAGSLAALARPDTVAISADAKLDVGGGVGRPVVVRDADGAEHRATVVAVYDRGLAFGDYLTGPQTLSAWAPGQAADAAYLRVDDGAASAVTTRLAADGWHVSTHDGWVERTSSAAAGMQHLSDTLLLTLLLFVAVAAADTLVLTTIGRRRENTLLARLGATRRQLLGVTAVEALVISTLAWVVGTLAALPGLVGVSIGLGGTSLPALDLPAYLALSAAVFALPLLCTLPTVWRQARTRP